MSGSQLRVPGVTLIWMVTLSTGVFGQEPVPSYPSVTITPESPYYPLCPECDILGENGEDEGESPFEDALETDRDSFTPSTRLAGQNRLITEAAYSFIDNRGFPEAHSYPELLLRYGLLERVEMRMGWNYEVGGGGEVSGQTTELETEHPTIEEESRIFYGVKLGVTEQESWLPESVVILQGFTPTSGEKTRTNLVATYAAGYELPNRWIFDSAIRYATGSEGEDHFSVWAPSMVLKVPVYERWNVHGEFFSILASDAETDFARHYFSPGVHYLVTPDLEVGVRVGWGLNDQSARFFSNVGFGWRY